MHASNWNQISRRLRKRAKRLLMRPIRSLRLWITVITLLTKTLRIVSKRWRMLSQLRGQLLSMKLFQSCKTPMTPLYQLMLLTLTVWRRQSKRLTMLWMQRHTTQRRQHKRSQIIRRLLQRRRMPWSRWPTLWQLSRCQPTCKIKLPWTRRTSWVIWHNKWPTCKTWQRKLIRRHLHFSQTWLTCKTAWLTWRRSCMICKPMVPSWLTNLQMPLTITLLRPVSSCRHCWQVMMPRWRIFKMRWTFWRPRQLQLTTSQLRSKKYLWRMVKCLYRLQMVMVPLWLWRMRMVSKRLCNWTRLMVRPQPMFQVLRTPKLWRCLSTVISHLSLWRMVLEQPNTLNWRQMVPRRRLRRMGRRRKRLRGQRLMCQQAVTFQSSTCQRLIFQFKQVLRTLMCQLRPVTQRR